MLATRTTPVTGNKYLDWSPCGRYIVIHGTGTTITTEVIKLGDCVTNCVVENNNIGDCTGGLCGIGMFGASCCNFMAKNVACCCGVNFSQSVFNKSLTGVTESAGSLRNLQVPGYCCCN